MGFTTFQVCSSGRYSLRVAALRLASRRRSPFPWRATLRSVPLGRSSASRHRDRYPRVVTVGGVSPSPHVAMQGRVAFTRQRDLRVLFRCRVRCCHQVLPPEGRSLLPWACSLQAAWSAAGSALNRGPGCKARIGSQVIDPAARVPGRILELAEAGSVQRPGRVLQNRPKWIQVKPGWGPFQKVCRSSLSFSSPGCR